MQRDRALPRRPVRAAAAGSATSSRTSSPRRRSATTLATASTCPDTRWPPSRSPERERALEMHEDRPCAEPPSVVSESVSATASASNARPGGGRRSGRRRRRQRSRRHASPPPEARSRSIRRVAPRRGDDALRRDRPTRSSPVNITRAPGGRRRRDRVPSGSSDTGATAPRVVRVGTRRARRRRASHRPRRTSRPGDEQHDLVDEARLRGTLPRSCRPLRPRPAARRSRTGPRAPRADRARRHRRTTGTIIGDVAQAGDLRPRRIAGPT